MRGATLFVTTMLLTLSLVGCRFSQLLNLGDEPMTLAPDAELIKVRPLNPDSDPNLTSMTVRANMLLDGSQEEPPFTPAPVGIDALWHDTVHFDKHTGIQRYTDTGFSQLTMNGSYGYPTVLLPHPDGDRTYRTYLNYRGEAEPFCNVESWTDKTTPFRSLFYGDDMLDDLGLYRVYAMINSKREMALIRQDEVTVNGIPAIYYRIDPSLTVQLMQKEYDDFQGTVDGDIYLTPDSHAIVKTDITTAGSALPILGVPFYEGMMEGSISFIIEFDDYNSAPAVPIQPECADEAKELLDDGAFVLPPQQAVEG